MSCVACQPPEPNVEALLRRATGIAEVSRGAVAGASITDLMQAGVSLVANELPCVDYAGVGEITPDGLKRITAVGVAEDQLPLMLKPDPSTYSAMQAARAGQSVLVTDWYNEMRFSKPDWLRLHDVKSSAFLPIITRPNNRVFGFLGAHARQSRKFADNETIFLETIANLLGDAIARQQAEKAAAQSAEQFRALAENSPDIISRFDHDLRVVYVNGSIEFLACFAGTNLIGRTARESGLQEPQVSALELALRQVFRTGAPQVFDFEAATALGPRTYLARMAPEFGRDGAVHSVLVVARDITDRRHEDQERLVCSQLLAQQKELRTLIGELLAGHQRDSDKAAVEERLTARERQLLSLIARGWTNREIGAELHVSRGNVKNQVSRLLVKLDVSDRTQAATLAARLGLLET